MKEKLEKCPLCGAKVVDAYNNVTKQFYYKCENSGCHFRLPKNYTEQEVSLQGIELKAECGGCGNHLTIACGPNSLYATCLRCDYDLRPNMVNGFIFKKHANAHNIEAEQEIKELKEAYKGVIDEDYSFDDFLETGEELQENSYEEAVYEESQKSTCEEKLKDTVEKSENKIQRNLKNNERAIQILNLLKNNLGKGMNSSEIATATNIQSGSIYLYLSNLRDSKEIKLVGYTITKRGHVYALYAHKESSIPEFPTVEANNGIYTTSNNFFKRNPKFMKEKRISTSTQLLDTLENNNLDTFVAITKQGIRVCYREKDIINLLDNEEFLKAKRKISKKVCIKKEEKSRDNIKNRVLNVLKTYTQEKSYPADEIAKKLKLNEMYVHKFLKLLREEKKIKIVGYKGTKLLYQIASGKLPELEIRPKEEYMTPFTFCKKYEILSVRFAFEKKIKEMGLKGYKVMTRRGVGNGYKIAELEEIRNKYFNKPNKEAIENTDIAYTKEIPTATSGKGILGFLNSVIHKNEKTELESEELISF